MRYCRSHVLDYEKKESENHLVKMCKVYEVVGWLEDNTPIIEGKVIPLSYKEKAKVVFCLLTNKSKTFKPMSLFFFANIHNRILH